MQLPGRLYPILDLEYCQNKKINAEDLLLSWDRLGLGYYQFRAKNLNETEYLEYARKLKASSPGLLLIANDYCSLAMENRGVFQGIHLGQEDFAALAEDRRICLRENRDKEWVRGISTHSLNQVQQAVQDGFWDYIAIGPVFPTDSKPGGKDPVLQELDMGKIIEFVSGEYSLWGQGKKSGTVPGIVFIGGITLNRLKKHSYLKNRATLDFEPIFALISAAAQLDELRALYENTLIDEKKKVT